MDGNLFSHPPKVTEKLSSRGNHMVNCDAHLGEQNHKMQGGCLGHGAKSGGGTGSKGAAPKAK